jgi:L-threonylcarbamoyladenylate synthase
MNFCIRKAARVLRDGGVITCPTEGVFGLSCMPDNALAILRLLAIKERDATQGLILIAASKEQLREWIAIPTGQIPDPDPARPISWVVPAAAGVSTLVRGKHAGVAVRITCNPTARAVCAAAASPLVSTSANLSGEPVAPNRIVLRRRFTGRVDYIVPGDCGPATGPSEIRVLKSGLQLR